MQTSNPFGRNFWDYWTAGHATPIDYPGDSLIWQFLKALRSKFQ